jgi:hypothetical protein
VVEDTLKQVQYLQAWSDGMTAVVAFLALILSALGLYLQRIDKRPQLRVQAKSAWLYVGTKAPAAAYAFEVANVGHVPVTVQNVYLRPGHRWNEKIAWPGGISQGPLLPCRLQTGESATWYVNRYPIRMFLKSEGYKKSARITVIAADGLNNFHKGRARLYLTPTWGSKLREVWIRLIGDA